MAALLELAGQPEPSLYLISGLAPPPPPLPPPPPAYDLADGSSDGVARVEPRSPPRSPAGTTRSPSPSPESPPSPAPPCSACGLAPPLCPASVPARCLTCDQAFAPGAVGYPEVQTEPAETWTPPDWPVEAGIGDGDGHPLTWGRVAYAHAWLVQHASCAAQAGGYSSDDEEAPASCLCTWHPVAIDERASHLLACRAWPGPLCGSCWAASCECGYAFDAVADAHSRWPNGRLRCHSCAS